ncbi:MAG: hypothetical protein F6K19_14345 [Cyanothece sp. SIO1E1]|nr:hypothetical protein [Cyanothece sp. SIO1E1]
MNPDPKIVDLKLLDTDYARLVAVESVPDEFKELFISEHYNLEYLGKQISRCRYLTDPEARDDALCKIAMTAELFTAADLEVIDDRTRETGRFSLIPDERKQVINWLKDELKIDLEDQ